ncbi:MAG: alkaline phosphatase D family protein [Ignavibacteriales bacterium]|nr:alkaline phosphatase D family protein [Ignavibacteriales bacterium]
MKRIYLLKICFLFFIIVNSCEQNHELTKRDSESENSFNQYAPEDAFSEDPKYPYYGSESKWNRGTFSENAAKNSYKRKSQRQLLEVLDGNFDEAIKICQSDLKDDPNDLESLFILTIAYCQNGQIDDAFNTAILAIEKGMPIERYLTGPRELLQPLYHNINFQKIIKNKNINILHGPLLGAVTDSSAKIWFRTTKESKIKIEVYENDITEKPLQIVESKSFAENDYTIVLSINGLKQNTTYLYNVFIDNNVELKQKVFTTFSSGKSKKNIRIAFGGGAGYTPKYEKIWNTINEREPNSLLLLGDNVYIDLPTFPNAFHDYTYYRRQSSKYFRELVDNVPTFSIWDDHDAAINDVWLGPYIDKPNWKLPMLKHFERNWNNPSYGTKDAPGCFYKFSISDVDFFMMDCRFYRTNPFKEGQTMIGPIQKEWLKSSILESKAKFKVIASSVPWSEGAKPGSHDTWDGYVNEREEIFQFIEENKIDGIILLSADRHRSDAWKIERENGYDFYEFTSSKLTNMHTHKLMPKALFGYNEKCSFGELDFNFKNDNPKVTYNIINIDGDLINSITVTLNQLSYK